MQYILKCQCWILSTDNRIPELRRHIIETRQWAIIVYPFFKLILFQDTFELPSILHLTLIIERRVSTVHIDNLILSYHMEGTSTLPRNNGRAPITRNDCKSSPPSLLTFIINRNMYELKEGRQMKPKTFASMISNMLYERRFGPFFTEPIVAGLDPVTFEPYVCGMDLIGCINNPVDFIVGGKI